MRRLILILKALTLFAVSAFGVKAIRDGWHILGTREIRVIGELTNGGRIDIDGGVGELGMGILILSGVWFLCRRWFMRADINRLGYYSLASHRSGCECRPPPAFPDEREG
jgi:hypothetical protein